jgi:2-dehydropantoate 2-reductase
LRIAVMGAGAMGGMFGATLADGGADVTLVDVSAQIVDRLRSDGVVIRRGGGERVVRLGATTDPAELGEVDVVLFFVKCYHTESAALLAQPLVGSDTVVASLQNGWGNGDVLARHFDPARLVIGVTYHSGTNAGPGVVLHTNTTDAPTLVGPYEGSDTANAEKLASAIMAGGLRAQATPNIRSEIWKKLVLNSSTLPTSALTRFTAGALGGDQPMTEVVNAIARETVAVGRAQGLDVDESERLEAIHTTLIGAGSGKASMLQDIENGRRTEIDVINAAVVRAAEGAGVDVPLNRVMLAMVKGYEAANGLT